jgi:hypothetical protein
MRVKVTVQAVLLCVLTSVSLYAYKIWKAPVYMLLLGVFFTAMLVVFLGIYP